MIDREKANKNATWNLEDRIEKHTTALMDEANIEIVRAVKDCKFSVGVLTRDRTAQAILNVTDQLKKLGYTVKIELDTRTGGGTNGCMIVSWENQ